MNLLVLAIFLASSIICEKSNAAPPVDVTELVKAGMDFLSQYQRGDYNRYSNSDYSGRYYDRGGRRDEYNCRCDSYYNNNNNNYNGNQQNNNSGNGNDRNGGSGRYHSRDCGYGSGNNSNPNSGNNNRQETNNNKPNNQQSGNDRDPPRKRPTSDVSYLL